MGWVKNAKASSMAREATEAWGADAPFFTPLLNMPATRAGLSGAIEDWPLMLTAITDAGWRLHTWAVCTDEKGRPQAMPLFTR